MLFHGCGREHWNANAMTVAIPHVAMTAMMAHPILIVDAFGVNLVMKRSSEIFERQMVMIKSI
jgi:hypothetical protein